jgi:hypothetical protein
VAAAVRCVGSHHWLQQWRRGRNADNHNRITASGDNRITASGDNRIAANGDNSTAANGDNSA